MTAVAHLQTTGVLIDLVGELFHIRGNLGLQCIGKHLPSTITDHLIEQRPTRTSGVVGGLRIVNYREKWAYLPEPACLSRS